VSDLEDGRLRRGVLGRAAAARRGRNKNNKRFSAACPGPRKTAGQRTARDRAGPRLEPCWPPACGPSHHPRREIQISRGCALGSTGQVSDNPGRRRPLGAGVPQADEPAGSSPSGRAGQCRGNSRGRTCNSGNDGRAFSVTVRTGGHRGPDLPDIGPRRQAMVRSYRASPRPGRPPFPGPVRGPDMGVQPGPVGPHRRG